MFQIFTFSFAAQQGSLDIVEKLLEYGADAQFHNSSGKDCLMLACFAGVYKEFSSVSFASVLTAHSYGPKNNCQKILFLLLECLLQNVTLIIQALMVFSCT